jgi:hypothetical protein
VVPIDALLSAFFSVLLLYEALRGFFLQPFPKAVYSLLDLADVVHDIFQMTPPV